MVSKDSIFSDIGKVYSVFLNIAVFISSSFFLGIFLIKVFGIKNLSGNLINGFLIFILIPLLLLNITKSKFLERVLGLLAKTVIVSGSIIVIVLFLNSLLKVSVFWNQVFLNVWKQVELALNEFVFLTIFPIVFLFVYIYLAVRLLRLITTIIKKTGRYSDVVGLALVFILLVFPLIAFRLLLPKLSIAVFSNFGWIFGFSLTFLHSNYLIKEIKKAFK